MTNFELALYGGGKMGFAMLMGWLDAGMKPEAVAVFDPNPSDALKETGVVINPEDARAEVLILAVKPQIMPELLNGLTINGDPLVISVAAGLSLESYQNALGASLRVVRAMPNTPAAIGEGITAIIGNAACSEEDYSRARELLQAVGQVVQLDQESDMDAVTGLSGSGPAYVFYMIEAMRQAGETQGLSAKLANQLALATVAGAGQLALKTGEDAAVLRKNVTSPGGTTQAGLEVLMQESDGLAPLMRATISAAADRSRELAKK